MSSPTENAERRRWRRARARARLRAAAGATAAVLAVAGVTTLTLAPSAHAASGCQVAYTLSSSWPGGFTAGISITNLGSPLTSWTLGFTLPGNEVVGQGWSATYGQSGQKVTAANVSYNGSLGTNGEHQHRVQRLVHREQLPGEPGVVHARTGRLHRLGHDESAADHLDAAATSPEPRPRSTTPSTSPSRSGHLYQSSDQWAQYAIGGYTIYNDEWGGDHNTQTLWVDSANKWGVYSTQPSTSGVKSYANISKSVGTAINSLSSATSTFNETNPSGGNWESAYDVWLNGSGIEVMVWTYVSGNVGPLGSSVGTVTLDGNTWTLYAGNNGTNPTYSFVRSGNETSGTVNLLNLLKYLQNTKAYFSNATLSTIQYGWEISGTNNAQENFTMNSYSASAS